MAVSARQQSKPSPGCRHSSSQLAVRLSFLTALFLDLQRHVIGSGGLPSLMLSQLFRLVPSPPGRPQRACVRAIRSLGCSPGLLPHSSAFSLSCSFVRKDSSSQLLCLALCVEGSQIARCLEHSICLCAASECDLEAARAAPLLLTTHALHLVHVIRFTWSVRKVCTSSSSCGPSVLLSIRPETRML